LIVYDGGFDADQDETTACLAPLGAGRRDLPCGSVPTCPLSQERQSERAAKGLSPLDASAVVCPLRFWGFRHRIELPVQQLRPSEADSGGVDAPVARIGGGRPAAVVAGVNPSLPLAGKHLAALEGLAVKLSTRLAKAMGRTAILRCLADTDIDIVYFYCHAQRDNAEGHFDPTLVFRSPGDPRNAPEYISAARLSNGPLWKHSPLAFLNGCGTGGISPEALSPFLLALVRDRGAAGVVSTDVKVWEPLAAEFAEQFLAAFLRGAAAGDALLEARWALLCKNNPLGLVYTLYASADLRLAPVPASAEGG
jgi:CHAT domain